jgi:hypothetical protein
VSSKTSEPPLRLEPRSSRQLALALLLVHAAAMTAVVNLALPAWMIMGLAGTVVMSLYITFNTQVLGRGRFALCSLVWEVDGDWTVISADGTEHKAWLRPSSVAYAWLVILNLVVQGEGNRSLVLMQDSLDARTFRRLLVRLRLEDNRQNSGK